MAEDDNRPRSRFAAGAATGWRGIAAAGVALEAIGLGAAAVAYGIHALGLPEPAFAVGLAAFCGVTAAGLGLVARGLLRGARWAVSAALTWQLLQTLAGVNLLGVRPALGIPLAVVGVLVGVAVVMGGRSAIRPDAAGTEGQGSVRS